LPKTAIASFANYTSVHGKSNKSHTRLERYFCYFLAVLIYLLDKYLFPCLPILNLRILITAELKNPQLILENKD
jgi:hypothetical protein